MTTRIWISWAAIILAANSLRAADDPQIIISARFTIGLSKAGEKRAERRGQWELYRQALAGKEDAQAAWRAIKPNLRTAVLAELSGDRQADQALRKHALRDLALLPASEDTEGAGLAALAQSALSDTSASLREYARQGLAARNDPRIISPLAKALVTEDGLVRENAALALKALGSPRVFEVIIEHWLETWGPGARANMFVVAQQSYISNYNIVGDMYEPQVSQFMTGVVLDAKSLRVEIDRYYLIIREIAPDDVKLPNNPAAWKEWLEKERPKLARAAEKKHTDAVALLSGADEE